MTVKDIKRIEWKYLINRKETLLFNSNADKSYANFKKLTGMNWKPDYIMRDSEGDYFTTPYTINSFGSVFSRKDVGAFNIFTKSLIYNVNLLDKFSEKIENIDFKKYSKNKLQKVLSEYLKYTTNAENYLLPMPLSDKIISEMIQKFLPGNSEIQKQKWLKIFTYPSKDNEHTKEEQSFYKLALAYRNKDKIPGRLIEAHLKKFGWFGARYWWNDTWNKKDIEGRLKNFFEQGRNPRTEIIHIDSVRKNAQAESKKLIRKLKIKRNSQLHNLIYIAKELAFLKTWRTDIIYRSAYRARNVFYEIAKRAGLKRGDLFYLMSEEVKKMAETGKIPVTLKEIRKRKEYYIKIVAGQKNVILSGKKWKEKINFLKPAAEEARVIKGNAAFPGKVRGKAVIVMNNRDIKRVKKSDILVATMTFPHFVPAMEKAAAFVTDEGGILCHAAIVSREMRKPCIIGTKIATQVLKDGQLVEVDANKGIVRIIK